MISIVIRNKNEAEALESTLSILTSVYSGDFDEIIIVDNNSTDKSIEIALKYNCRIVTLDNFSYGRAINRGVEASRSEYVLLLSAHAVPIGQSFFKNTKAALEKSGNIAGIRYVNSIDNYKRAIKNNFKIVDPVNAGLLAACCIINRNIWNGQRFNEDLIAVEDKEWSARVMDAGFEILDLNETFLYFIKRNPEASLKKYRIETVASYGMAGRKFSSLARIVASLMKKLVIQNTKSYFISARYAIRVFNNDLEIRRQLKSHGKNK